MPFTDVAKNLMLNELGTVALYASLHTVDAPTAGGDEVTGGTPAYARKALTWGAASAGSMVDSGTDPEFDVPACTVKAVGFWSALTAGTFYGYSNVTDEIFAAQGTYTLTAFTLDLNS